jgi:hypothetical protein
MISDGLYKREAKDFFQLFFYVDTLKSSKNVADLSIENLTSPTFYASNVSMFNQRMGGKDDAVMVSTVGSYGNHAHANGISVVLFANQYALGPDSGKGSSYWHSDFREYFARFPAHNTVIVDGKSSYSNMRSFNPFQLDNAYPKSGETPSFDKITFSKVSFLEPTTVSDQQRFTAIIKSNSAKSYIVDVFRSKKQQNGAQKHEYIYHNLGQDLEIIDSKNTDLEFEETSDLSSKKGDLKGYNYFTDKFKAQTSNAIQAVFKLKTENNSDNLMKLWVKGSENQTVYKVKAPASNAISKGTAPSEILEKPMPTLILKRDEAAWYNPFAVVFNPYFKGKENPVSNVLYSSLEKYQSAQIIDVLLKDNLTNDHIVLNASDSDIAKEEGFFQKGLLSITRQVKASKTLDFLFLSGMYKYENNGWDIVSSGNPFTFSIEKRKEGFTFETDEAITINMPFIKGDKPAELRLYESGKLVASRKGTTNRNNDAQLVFKIEKGYDKAEIILNGK